MLSGSCNFKIFVEIKSLLIGCTCARTILGHRASKFENQKCLFQLPPSEVPKICQNYDFQHWKFLTLKIRNSRLWLCLWFFWPIFFAQMKKLDKVSIWKKIWKLQLPESFQRNRGSTHMVIWVMSEISPRVEISNMRFRPISADAFRKL